MSRLKRWIRNWLDDDQETLGMVSMPECGSFRPGGPEMMILRVWNAGGGKVIEFVKEDYQKDRTDRSLYIITNEQDLGERIAKLVNMETLR